MLHFFGHLPFSVITAKTMVRATVCALPIQTGHNWAHPPKQLGMGTIWPFVDFSIFWQPFWNALIYNLFLPRCPQPVTPEMKLSSGNSPCETMRVAYTKQRSAISAVGIMLWILPAFVRISKSMKLTNSIAYDNKLNIVKIFVNTRSV